MAEDLRLEQKTVRNQLVRVYALFVVPGQSQLLAAILRDANLRKIRSDMQRTLTHD